MAEHIPRIFQIFGSTSSYLKRGIALGSHLTYYLSFILLRRQALPSGIAGVMIIWKQNQLRVFVFSRQKIVTTRLKLNTKLLMRDLRIGSFFKIRNPLQMRVRRKAGIQKITPPFLGAAYSFAPCAPIFCALFTFYAKPTICHKIRSSNFFGTSFVQSKM